LIGFGVVAGTAAFVLATDDATFSQGPRYRGGLLQSGSASHSTGRTALMLGLAGAAVLSTGAGLAVWFTRPDHPEEPKVGVAPTGLVISGQFR
jgi:hypothetical protein